MITPDDLNRFYNTFQRSYLEKAGSSWTREKFFARARFWTFYGDEDGFIAFREQRNGIRKLVCAAGEMDAITRGLRRLMEEREPVWGLVSERLIHPALRFGLMAPHHWEDGAATVEKIMLSIPDEELGGKLLAMRPDGGLIVEYNDLGTAIKYFVANRPYLKRLGYSAPAPCSN